MTFRPLAAPSFFFSRSKAFPREDPALARFFPNFDGVLVDLHRYSDEEIRGAVWTRAFLLPLKHIRSPDRPERLPEILGLLKGLIQSETGLGHLEAMLRYVVRVSEPIRTETLERVVAEAGRRASNGDFGGTVEAARTSGRPPRGHRGGPDRQFWESGLRLLPEIRPITDTDKLCGLLKDVWRGDDLSSPREKLSTLKK
jgi:hypothetical protein